MTRRVVHVVDPGNADLGFLLGKIQRDPVVIIAQNETQERAIHQAGFAGMTVNLELYRDLGEARAVAAALYPEHAPFVYAGAERAKIRLWLAGVLERYEITFLTLDEALAIVGSLSIERAA